MPKPKYPHMRQWEAAILEKYQERHKWAGVWSYDVHLKVRHQELPDHLGPADEFLWNQLTAKRIDAVLEHPKKIYVIEIKDRLRPSAVGQALTYKILYEEQFAPINEVIPVVLTPFTDHDMMHVCEELGIQVWRP